MLNSRLLFIIMFRFFNYSIFFSRINKLPRLLVASEDGFLYVYNLDPEEGGECSLVRQHRFVG